ncbi:response regulator [Rhodocytophaga rosea]|uniref:histidine kinase n=1 Tax=Rhodocytophaga rosea TaxID=2704465 RepID=A0A6C0GM89_9BACT|nr:ATP-binding protein [Rhodocytophaga rosea]QHT69129.1 response regulator [Rhodocytophaga rosea]
MQETKKILIIEDNEEDRYTFKRYLSTPNCAQIGSFQVIETSYGNAGITLYKNEQPDCVLLDFSLPDMDGLEVLENLRNNSQPDQLCVILLTGTGNETIAVEALKNGAADYLTKGKFTVERFCHALEGALEKTAIRQELARQRELLYTQNAQLEQAKQELEQKTRQLEISNADLERFAYAASHDLQEPLRTVEGFIKLLRNKFKQKLTPEAEEYMEFMSGATTRMKALIEGLLDYSKVSGQDDKQEEVNLKQIILQVKENLLVSIENASAQLIVGNLPTVKANRWQMLQLFQNLIGNAIKFRSEQPLIITIAAQPKPGQWVISVGDTGIGMDMKHARMIFEPFKKLHSRDQFEGSGIGLATCQKIVENHGGRIWIESTLGQGSTFYFTLPQ